MKKILYFSALAVSIIVCTYFYISSIIDINKKYPNAPIVDIPAGTSVTYNEMEYKINGIQVFESNKSFLSSLNLDEQKAKEFAAQLFGESGWCIVELSITNNTKNDIEKPFLFLERDGHAYGINYPIYRELNVSDVVPAETQKTFYIVYQFINEYNVFLTKENTMDIKGAFLTLTLYPEKMRLMLNNSGE